MRSEQITKTIPVYQKTYDENGELFDIQQTGETEVTITELIADEGKLFVRISDNAVLGDRITLGTDDREENYTEV